MENTIYPGQPLEDDQIRLVKLRPGSWEDPIQCELYNASPERTQYHALSYVWGAREDRRKIVVDGHAYPATANLELALRYLRNQYQGVSLWIDAICINQEDFAEKSHQVGMMDQIYMQCKKAIVFLGDRLEDEAPTHNPSGTKFIESGIFLPESTDTTIHSKEIRGYDAYEALHLIKELSSGKHMHRIPALVRSNTWEGQGNPLEQAKAAAIAHHKETLQQEKLLETLRRLMHGPHTPWWNRVWSIQEVTFAPEVEIVHGTMTAPWSMFEKAASSYSIHTRKCCAGLFEAGGLLKDQSKILADFSQCVSEIGELRTSHRRLVDQDSNVGNGTLLDLLQRSCDREASDARDKVYALLSLAQAGAAKALIKPDYSLNESQVFSRATVHCIYSTQSLSLFTTELGRNARNDLPSWVPDWSAKGSYHLNVRAAALALYDDYPKETVTAQPLGDDELVVQGGRIAQVAYVGEVMSGDDGSAVRDTLTRWWDDYLSQPSMDPKQFWRMICADFICRPKSIDSVRRVEPVDELAFATWALFSEQSPFRSAGAEFASMWSDAARAWQALLLLWPEGEVLYDVRGPDNRLNVVPCGLTEDIESRSFHIGALLSYANSSLTVEQMLDSSDEFNEEAPWKQLLQSASELFRQDIPSIGFRFRSHKDEVQTIDNSIIAATLSRRLVFVKHTAGCHFGLGPAATTVTDELHLLRGGRTPFILRPVPQDNTNNQIGIGKSVEVDEPESDNELCLRSRFIQTARYAVIGDFYALGLGCAGVRTGEEAEFWRDVVLV